MTPEQRNRRLLDVRAYLESALDAIRPVVQSDEENALRLQIKDAMIAAATLATKALEGAP